MVPKPYWTEGIWVKSGGGQHQIGGQNWVLRGGKSKAGGRREVRVEDELGDRDTESICEADFSHTIPMSPKLKSSSRGRGWGTTEGLGGEKRLDQRAPSKSSMSPRKPPSEAPGGRAPACVRGPPVLRCQA